MYCEISLYPTVWWFMKSYDENYHWAKFQLGFEYWNIHNCNNMKKVTKFFFVTFLNEIIIVLLFHSEIIIIVIIATIVRYDGNLYSRLLTNQKQRNTNHNFRKLICWEVLETFVDVLKCTSLLSACTSLLKR